MIKWYLIAISVVIGILFSMATGLGKWIDVSMENNLRCVHLEKVTANKVHMVTWNGKNEEGVDKSCYVEFNLNGKEYRSEWWNVGNCNDSDPIEIEVADYTCH